MFPILTSKTATRCRAAGYPSGFPDVTMGNIFLCSMSEEVNHHLTPAFLNPATNSSNSRTRPDSMIQTPIAAGVAP